MPSPIPRPPRPNRTFSGVNISSPHSSPPRNGPIVAESLSTITPVADDPPLQFITPPAQSSGGGSSRYPKPALLLYFVRVPGSQDLFLTPMHPLKSTVTAEDIVGCLYYVYVHPVEQRLLQQVNIAHPLPLIPGESTRPSLLSSGSFSGRKWSTHNILGGGAGSRGSLKDFSFTLIRRDPATGDQWNVAEVCSRVSNVAQSVSEGKHGPPPPIVISLPGKGYTKFLNIGSQVRRKPVPQHNLPPLPSPPQPPLGMQQGRSISAEEEEDYFRRKRAYNEVLAFRERAIKDQEVIQAEEEIGRGLIRQVVYDASGEGLKWWKKGLKKRHWKSNSLGKEELQTGGEGNGEKKERWKGYTFDGLWGPGNVGTGEKEGTCRFKEAAGGKILKCKYYPYNANPRSGSSEAEQSYLASAMEFKLPPSSTFHLHHGRGRSPSPSDNSESMGTDEGSVGSGGPGEMAKMATFVVHNAGMEMLDLLVAANVALFWRKWEGWVGERVAVGQQM
ncbi:hypothetical protein BDZ91DRAFT_725988 [Kalaharituber pfeilii]|nr:hypothetical protein BDZ91DRAFT_725988 [Kalaharituber pfeilii]